MADPPFQPFHDPAELRERVLALYQSGGYPKGDPTGWRCLDSLYSVVPGQWTVVTGMPSSGKSEWLDALAMNLATDHGWRFAVFSPENQPIETHIAKLTEKRLGKPFMDGPTRPMTVSELDAATGWVLERFKFIVAARDASPEALLATAFAYRDKRVAPKWGVILDPWNTLDHLRGDRSETDYVSHILSHVVRMVREGNLHCWLVVHPKQMQRVRADGKFPVPHPYDISGSAHWYNKPDNIVCIHRPDKDDNVVEVHVQKVRFKHVGKIGVATLRWSRVTGRYMDLPVIYDVTTGKLERYKEEDQ